MYVPLQLGYSFCNMANESRLEDKNVHHTQNSTFTDLASRLHALRCCVVLKDVQPVLTEV